MVFHAGTKAEDGKVLAVGGRVLNVTARGDTLQEARDRAYAMVDSVDWPQGFFRRDIDDIGQRQRETAPRHGDGRRPLGRNAFGHLTQPRHDLIKSATTDGLTTY